MLITLKERRPFFGLFATMILASAMVGFALREGRAGEASSGANRVATTHIERGLRHLQKGNLSYAKSEFEFVLRHDSDLKSVAYLNLGVISFVEGNLERAVQYYQSATQLKPDYAEAYFNLGAAYYKKGELKKAEEAFLKAIELQPDYGRAHYSLGAVYLDQKNYDLASKHAEKAKEYGVPYKTLEEKLKK